MMKMEGCAVKLKYIEKPLRGRDCPYFKKYATVYGKCSLPANKGGFCNTKGPVHTNCPLPGWDRVKE